MIGYAFKEKQVKGCSRTDKADPKEARSASVMVGAFRVIYVAKFTHAVYVLHVFQKRTLATTKADIALVTQRYKLIGGQS